MHYLTQLVNCPLSDNHNESGVITTVKVRTGSGMDGTSCSPAHIQTGYGGPSFHLLFLILHFFVQFSSRFDSTINDAVR